MFDGTTYQGDRHPIDRRGSPRRRSYLGGILVSAFDSFCAACVVRNRSAAGARVETAHPEFMPGNPLLVVVNEATAYETQAVWLEEGAVGLRLTASHPLGGAVPAHVSRARELWVEQLPRRD